MAEVRAFRFLKEIVWGRLSYLENIQGKRTLIICGPNMAKREPLAQAKHYLKKASLFGSAF